MKNIILTTLLIVLLVIFVGCKKEEVITVADKNINDVVEITVNHNNEYIIDNGYIDFDTTEMEETITKVLGYLNSEHGVDDQIYSFKLSTLESRYDPVNDMIMVNTVDYNNIDIVVMLLSMTLDRSINYGLIYGYGEVVAEELSIDFEKASRIHNYTLNQVEEYWYLSDLQYINFLYDIALEEELLFSKWLASKYVSSWMETHSKEELLIFIEESNSTVVKDNLDEWVLSIYPEFNGTTSPQVVIFKNHLTAVKKNYRNQKILEFSSDGIDWLLNVNGKDTEHGTGDSPKFSDENSMTFSVKKFYELMGALLENKSVIDELLKDEETHYPTVRVELYFDGESSSFYDIEGEYIGIQSLQVFTHEYIHYLDDVRMEPYEVPDLYVRRLMEMRACYYDVRSPMMLEYMLEVHELSKSEEYNPTYTEATRIVNEMWPMAEGEELVYLIHHVYSTLPEAHGSISWSWNDSYRMAEWISFMRYLEDTYGFEETDHLTLYSEFLDGTEVDWEVLEEDWLLYLDELISMQKDE